MKTNRSILDRIVSTFFTKSPRKRFLTGAALTAALILGTGNAYAQIGMQTGVPNLTVNYTAEATSVVGFGGKQWYVIQNNSAAGSIRLLHKWDENNNFGTAQYNSSGVNDYLGGQLQTAMADAANALPSGEQAQIIARDITDVNGGAANGQKLWAISEKEHYRLSSGMQRYDNDYWFRSPDAHVRGGACVARSDGGLSLANVDNAFAVRPAFDLNLASVLFTSYSSGLDTKAAAAVGTGWNSTITPTEPGRAIKFTFQTDTIATPNLTLRDTSTLGFDFTGATTGANTYVSGYLDGTTSAYARFTNNTALGSFSALSGIGNGVYKLKIFGEEVNGDGFSDFASKPTEFELAVVNGNVVSLMLLTTDVDFGLDNSTIGLKDGKDYTQKFTIADTATFRVIDGKATISGTVDGNGNIVKDGAGSFTVTDVFDMPGMVTVAEGALETSGTTGSFTVLHGATIAAVGGAAPVTIGSNLTLANGATVQLVVDSTNNTHTEFTAENVNLGATVNISVESLATDTSGLVFFEATAAPIDVASTTFNLALNGLSLTGSRADGSTISPELIPGGMSLMFNVTPAADPDANAKNVTWTGETDNTWDISTVNWSDDDNGDASTKFLDGDAVTFNLAGTPASPIEITIAGSQKTVAQMTVDNTNSLTIHGNILGAAVSPILGATNTGKLLKAGTGTLTLNGENEFATGITFTGGTIVLGNENGKSLGTWQQGSGGLYEPERNQAFMNSQGMVTVTDGDTTIKVEADRTITNYFVLGVPEAVGLTENRTGSLTFDIADDATLTISGVVNTASGNLGTGGAINVNVPVASLSDESPLKFTGGHLVFENNKANGSGAVGARFTDADQHSVLDFTALQSVTFTGNIAENASGAGAGGAVYSYSNSYSYGSSSVTFGDNATFTENTAGNFGGAIYSQGDQSSVRLGNHATFTENSVGGFGGGIYSDGGLVATVTLGDYATFTGNTAGNDINSGNSLGGAIRCHSVIQSGFGPASSSVSLGSYATFTGNIAGNAVHGWGGAIASWGSDDVDVTLAAHAYLASNRAGGNNNGGLGGAIYSRSNVTLSGHTLFENNLVSAGGPYSYGGAIYLDGNGTTNTATLNADTGAIAFRNNYVNVDTTDINNINPTTGTANSIHLAKNTQLDLRGSSNIYFDDPISTQAADGGNSLVKSGTGFVQFVGNSVLNLADDGTNPVGGGTVTVSGGTFRVVDGASFTTEGNDATFTTQAGTTLAGGGTITASQGFTLSGTISPDSDRFEIPTFVTKASSSDPDHYNYFEPGRTTVSETNKIGTLTLTGDVQLDAAVLEIDINLAGTPASPVSDKILVTGTATFTGATTIGVTLPTWTTGTFDVFTATDLVTETGSTYAVDLGTAADAHRAATASVSGNSLQILLADRNASIIWAGTTSAWDTAETPKNWKDTGGAATFFKSGDTVLFDNSTTIKTVDVTAAGVSVESMAVTGTGYTFNLIASATTKAISATNDIDLGNATLNITGYTPGDNLGTNSVTVITTTGGTIENFNSAVSVLNQPSVDFLSASAALDAEEKNVIVETGLSWYSTATNAKAHGDFTIDGATNIFTLGAVLSDTTTNLETNPAWDGKSLTKKGEGTLILTAANTYTGDTTVSAGILKVTGMLGNGIYDGAISVTDTLIFDQGDAQILSGKFSGTGDVTKSGIGTLTLSADSTAFSGTFTQETGIVHLAATAALGGVFTQNGGTFTSANGATLNTATFEGDVTPTGTLNITGDAVFDGANVDFGLLTSGNKITVGGHAELTNASASIDAAGVTETKSFTLLQFGSITASGIHAISFHNPDGSRVDTYVTASALMCDVIVGNTTLYWNGSDGKNTWNDDDINRNWTNGNINTWFKTGDHVVFDDRAANKAVSVDPDGVTVDTMQINDDYRFTGGTITATGAVNVAEGKSLGLNIADNSPMLHAASLTFGTGSTLNVTGYTPGETDDYKQGFERTTVITTTGGVFGFDPLVTITDQAGVDYLSSSVFLDENNIVAETRLSWYSADPTRKAHGTFTADGDFTLGAALTDNSVSTNKEADWDGKSLTKKGLGTLILTGANTTNGTLNHDEGGLEIAVLWSGDYAQNFGAGTFASADGATITGNAIFRSNVAPTGTLNIDGDATLDGATVDFGFLSNRNKIVVGGHAEVANVTAKLDLAGAGSGHYTLAEYGSMTINDIPSVEIKGLGENRGDFYINAAVDDTALIYDLIVGNTTLYWYGEEGGMTWNSDKSNRNWTDNFILTWYRSGDDVVFSDKAPSRQVDVTSPVFVNSMTVSASGYVFNLTVDAAAPDDSIINATGTVDLGDATLVVDVANVENLEKGRKNATRTLVVEGDTIVAGDATTLLHPNLSRVRFATVLDTNFLAFDLWLPGYLEDYGRRLSPNGNRMAGLIDELPSENSFRTALDSLTDDDAILSGIENTTGEGYAMSMTGTVKLQQVFDDFLVARKPAQADRCTPCGPTDRSGYELWGTFTGGSHDRSSFSRYSGYDLSNYGVALGIERRISRNWFGGIAFGYDNANLKLDDRYAKDEFETFRTSLYGGYTSRNWYASGHAGYSKNWHDMKRNNYALGFSNRGKYDDDIFSTGLELGRVMKLRNGSRFIPSVGIHWVHLDNPAFSERGDMASTLCVSKSHYDSVRLPIGARLNRTFTGNMISWTPEVRAFYVAELSDTRSALRTAFASSTGTGSVFADSGNGGRNGGIFGAGATAQLTQRLSFGIDYDYEVWERYDRHNLTGNVTYRW